jgi:hypothetical protein
MATWCLTKEKAERFLKGLRSGEIDPRKLVALESSAERRIFLEKFVGKENAKYVNTEFEGKLLLKNQQRGWITWARKYSGLKEKPLNNIVTKVAKLKKALNPNEENGMLSDIIEKKLGVSINEQEAKTLLELNSKAEKLYNAKVSEWEQSYDYNAARLKVLDFIDNATPEIAAPTKLRVAGKVVNAAISVARALKTGFDFSFPFRQGMAYTGTREWRGAFKRMFSYAKSQNAIDRLKINMMMNKYSEQAIKFKRDLGLTILGEKFTQMEEQFASKFIKKVPLLKGSERAFVGFASDLRFNRFVRILENLDKAGKGITDNLEAMRNLAKSIAAASGRGSMGSFEGLARPLATVLFSPRWIMSRIQIITNAVYKGGFNTPATAEARLALARLVGVSASLLGMYKLTGHKVETDSRGTDFGKLIKGNTRIDITGGLAPYIVLFSRLSTLSTKTGTGKINKLNKGKFGEQTAFDVLTNFITSKTSPVASVARDILKGKNFRGNPVKIEANSKFIKYLADQLFTPLVASDTLQAYKDASGDINFSAIAGATSLFGFGVSTYSSKTDWTQSTGKELKQFKEKVGEEEFLKANDEYNKQLQERMKNLVSSDKYKNYSEEEKLKIENMLEDKIKSEIFKKYKFQYKQEERDTKGLKEMKNLIK